MRRFGLRELSDKPFFFLEQFSQPKLTKTSKMVIAPIKLSPKLFSEYFLRYILAHVYYGVAGFERT